MRNLTHVLLIGSALLHSVLAIAQDDGWRAGSANRAVNITLGNTGGGLDDAALRSVRKLVGKAITANTVDTFAVYSPRAGGPIPIEGGLSACAEAGFNASPQKFNAFVSQLRSIHPRPGTFLNVELTERCKPADSTGPLSCGGIAGTTCRGAQQYCDFGPGQCKVQMRKVNARPNPLFVRRYLSLFAAATAKLTRTYVPRQRREYLSSTRESARNLSLRHAEESLEFAAPREKYAWMIQLTIATLNAGERIARVFARPNKCRAISKEYISRPLLNVRQRTEALLMRC